MPRPVVLALLAAACAAALLLRLGGAETDAAGRSPAGEPAYWNAGPAVAAEITPRRRRFIRRADRTCARTVARGKAAQAAYARRVAGRRDAQERITRFHVRWHRGQYAALRALGEPPDGRLQYRAFLATVADRVRLEAQYVPLMRARRAAEALAIADRVAALAARGEALGRRFGLTTCASRSG